MFYGSFGARSLMATFILIIIKAKVNIRSRLSQKGNISKHDFSSKNVSILSSFVTSGARSGELTSSLNNGQIEHQRPACHGHTSENHIATRLCVQFTRGLHRVVRPFNQSCLQPDLTLFFGGGAPSQVAPAA